MNIIIKGKETRTIEDIEAYVVMAKNQKGEIKSQLNGSTGFLSQCQTSILATIVMEMLKEKG